MKKNLLLCAAAIFALGTQAQEVKQEVAEKVSVVEMQTPALQVKENCKVLESKTVSNGVMLQTCKGENGKVFKRILSDKSVKFGKAKAATRAEGGTLNENFEGYTGAGWLPEGWTAVSKAEDNVNPWTVTTPFSFFGDPGNEGNYACEAALSEQFCDEWLITPSFSVSQDDQLVFLGLIDLFFMLDYTYLDWDTGEYSEKVPTAVLKIWATEDGGENWTLVHDYFEEAASMTYDQLMDDYFDNGGLYAPRHVSLNDFAGKTIQVGFQYVGTNGNNVGIDLVTVAKPTIDCSYEFPLWAPFFGISRNLMGLNLSIPVLPVYQPITWKGQYDQSVKDAFPYWIYYNADSQMDFALGDELTTSYTTDYSSDFTTRNNLFYPPTFCVSADGWSDGEFQKYTYFQSGGHAVWANSGEILTFGFSAYDPAAEGHTNATGPDGIAVFGTGSGVDDFWSKQLGQDGYLTAVSNICYTPEYPIAFREIYTQAKASTIRGNATFTLDIMPVTDEGTILEPIASAKIKGNEAILGLEQGSSTYYTFNFDFGETLVLSKETIGTNRFMIRWGGIHNSAIELAPMQSYWESQKGINHGFIWLQVKDSEEGAIVPISMFTGVNQGFGIMIDGWYPWLEAETSEVTIPLGERVNINLDSYYPGSDLNFELPEGLNAIAIGELGQTVLSIENTGLASDDEIVVSAPGVSKTIKVSSSTVGIVLPEAINSETEAVFNMQGTKVDAANAPAGIYIYKQSNGAIKKVVKQ